MRHRGNGAATGERITSGMSSTDSSSAPVPPVSDPSVAGDTARRILRTVDRATLATAQRDASGWPYPSLVQVAADHDGSPLLLISTLADHTRNIAADPRVGLLFDGTAGLAQPLAGTRVSVLGRAVPSDDPRLRARYLARHPGASLYAGFGDFGMYRVVVERAHLVAGFGRIRWMESSELLLPNGTVALAEAEADILAHMNSDHSDAVRLYATALLGLPDAGEGESWTMTGIDPEGCDLRCGGMGGRMGGRMGGSMTARVDFDQRVDDPRGARLVLAEFARRARGMDGGPPYT